MALKNYLDLSGLAHFRNKILADNIINNTYSLVPAGARNINLQYYTKSGNTYTAVAITDVPATIPADTYYTIDKGSLEDTQHAPSIKGMSTYVTTYVPNYVDDIIERIVAPAIDAKVTSVNYGTTTISGTSFTGLYTTNGTTHTVVAVDSTAGGTSESTSLVTSGAVNSGLASINAAKSDKIVSYSLSLPTNSWTGSASPYSQVVSVTGTTEKSKIDIQADSVALTQMITDKTKALYIANNNGTLTAYALGEKPTVNLTVQVTRTELA